ncbi:hypothetical protein OIV36_32030 [Burkholderia pseudomallei]|uniref:hypothetical protein n=1 Tax=Burkholderia pseudomallei TaxID=28450 RepID=UPI0021F70CB8|nr:hypothetical protein [Burkholderia pseudomallei]MCW0054098.1 hypothetical protein [Burkholderia pseudomallei]
MDQLVSCANEVACATDAARVTVSVTLHPIDHARMAGVAKRSGITERDFIALAIHRGVCELSRIYADKADLAFTKGD